MGIAVVPGSAGAFVVIGVNEEPDPSTSQAINESGSAPAIVFNADAPFGVRLLAPSDGLITRWRVSLGRVFGDRHITLKVLAPEGGAQYKVVRSGPVEAVANATSNTNAVIYSFPASVPIGMGQGIGVLPEAGVTMTRAAAPPAEWKLGRLEPPPPDGFSGTATFFDQTSPSPAVDLV